MTQTFLYSIILKIDFVSGYLYYIATENKENFKKIVFKVNKATSFIKEIQQFLQKSQSLKKLLMYNEFYLTAAPREGLQWKSRSKLWEKRGREELKRKARCR